MQLHWFTKASARRSAWGRLLKAVGPSWSASPVRRFVQAGALGAFLFLFVYAAWPYGGESPEHVGRPHLWAKWDLFLAMDPLVTLSAMIAGRAWVASLGVAAAVLAVSLLLPRAFCGYLCPLGTLIDVFDWAVTRRLGHFLVRRPGPWRHLRYYVLAGILAAAAGGVVLTGYAAAIPLVTRGLEFLVSPLQVGLTRGWDQVPPMHATQVLSLALFGGVFLLGFLRPRFWCRHVCPTGAVFSLISRLRLTERKVQPHCVACGRCAQVCSFDAINDDFTTVGANCAFCQTCAGVCPVDAIGFSTRLGAKAAADATPTPAADEPRKDGELSRRGLLIGLAAGTAAGGLAAGLPRLAGVPRRLPLRPPGSVDEDLFVRLCVRCGECLRVCPSGILQPAGPAQGLETLWTPWANADWAGCDPACNRCGQACPTGAIAALALAKKRQTRMGLAQVDAATCLACQGKNDCQTDHGSSLLCRDACEVAGYSAIVSEGAEPPAPTVRSEACVGCGLCQAACFAANVAQKKVLRVAAIRVQPGRRLTEPTPTAITAPSGTQPAATGPAGVDVPYTVPGE